jgi:Flp pilus assembly protein TadG
VRILTPRRLRDEEDGVTMVIVALLLVGMIGMVVLVVDVGGLLWNRRAMVNASDAAALAAAKSCVLPPTLDPRSAEQAADEWATDNATGAQTAGMNILQISGCDTSATGYVTVQYGADQQLFFAGIFGQGQGHVTTQATAIWGPPGGGTPMPIVIYQESFNDCPFDAVDPNKTCYVWEDNNNVNAAQSAFGLLDLRTDNPTKYGWNSNPGVACSDPGGLVDQWISNYPDPSIGDLTMNYPNPTYVCRASGNQQNTWNDLALLKGKTLMFPINRCDTTLPGNPGGQLLSGSTSEATCPQTPGQYDIIGFFAAKLVELYKPNDPAVQGGSGSCTTPRVFPGPNNPFAVYSMFEASQPSPCPPSPPDAITNITLTKNGGPGQGPVLGTDYTVDYTNADDPLITWLPAGPAMENQSYNVKFNWSTAGACGVPPSNNNSGHCMILQPVEVQIGGTHPGQGVPSSNVRAVKLCEPTIPGSCSPVSVPNP